MRCEHCFNLVTPGSVLTICTSCLLAGRSPASRAQMPQCLDCGRELIRSEFRYCTKCEIRYVRRIPLPGEVRW